MDLAELPPASPAAGANKTAAAATSSTTGHKHRCILLLPLPLSHGSGLSCPDPDYLRAVGRVQGGTRPAFAVEPGVLPCCPSRKEKGPVSRAFRSSGGRI